MNDVGLLLSIGGFVVAVVGLIGGIIVRDRQLHKTIDDKVGAVSTRLDTEATNLHNRVNRLRDDMVRHSDLKAHTDRIESMLANVQGQLNMLIQRLLKE